MESLSENILQIATKKFSELGIRRVSIDDICNELRISKKTFYSVFSQKEEMLDIFLDSLLTSKVECFEKLHEDVNAIDALILIIKEIRKSIDKEPTIFIYDLKKYYPTLFDKFRDIQMNKMREGFANNLRKGVEEGYYREDLDVEMTSLFYSLQMRYTFDQIQQINSKITKKRLMEFFIDLIIKYITNDKGFEYIQNKFSKEPN